MISLGFTPWEPKRCLADTLFACHIIFLYSYNSTNIEREGASLPLTSTCMSSRSRQTHCGSGVMPQRCWIFTAAQTDFTLNCDSLVTKESLRHSILRVASIVGGDMLL